VTSKRILTDILAIKIEKLIKILIIINLRPKKCLNYSIQFEKFLYELIDLFDNLYKDQYQV